MTSDLINYFNNREYVVAQKYLDEGPSNPLRDLGEKIKEKAYDKIVEEKMDEWGTGRIVYGLIPGGWIPALSEGGKKAALAEKFESEIREDGEFDHIPDLLAKFFDGRSGDEAEKEPAIPLELSTHISSNEDFLTNYESAKSRVDGWKGEAVTSFQDSFMNPLNDAAKNQRDLAREIYAGLKVHMQIVYKAHNFVLKIGNNTFGKLDEHREQEDAATPLIDLGLLLTTFTNDNAKKPKGGKEKIGMVLSGLNTANGVNKVVKAEGEISGDSVYDIIDSMEKAISDLESDIAEQEDAITDGLEKTLDNIKDMKRTDQTRAYFEPLRPRLLRNDITIDDMHGA